MTAAAARDRTEFTELAGLLGRAYLRLTQKAPNVAASAPRRATQKLLDLRSEESVTVVGRQQWI